MGVVGIRLPPSARTTYIPVVILPILAILLQVGEALAVAELAPGSVTAAGTAAAKAILSRRDTIAIDHGVDEPEVLREGFIINLIYNRDWYAAMCREGSQLAPVASSSFVSGALQRAVSLWAGFPVGFFQDRGDGWEWLFRLC